MNYWIKLIGEYLANCGAFGSEFYSIGVEHQWIVFDVTELFGFKCEMFGWKYCKTEEQNLSIDLKAYTKDLAS